MTDEMIKFAERKTSIARCLMGGGCGGGYYEAILILSSTISGIASLLWPGDGIDRNRFIELLVNYSDPNLKTGCISLPLLTQDLQKRGSIEDSKSLASKFLPSSDSEIVIGADVDRGEEDVVGVCPRLTLREIRKFSHASILYSEVRSGVVHEYEFSEKGSASAFTMTNREAYVSYLNTPSGRKIYFHFEYIVQLVRSVALFTQPLLGRVPLDQPNGWWIEGR